MDRAPQLGTPRTHGDWYVEVRVVAELLEGWCGEGRAAAAVFVLEVGLMRALFLLPVVLALAFSASARDLDGRYANSPLKQWFESLASKRGLCCSDADGRALSDVDWESKDGHYRVWIEGAWHDVPEDAVVTVPNRAGRTMVWPVRGTLGITIICFMPGPMT